MKKNICVGLLAHVDAGKTTLSESILYEAGAIKTVGRVDRGDAFLDTYEIEKARGITVFSKQAVFDLKDMHITLVDTPGHVDFSAEMERTLQVLDIAVLIISGTDGVQGHTLTLWKLLERYDIPVFLFVNKMDRDGIDRAGLLSELKNRLSDRITDFEDRESEAFLENVAMCDEGLLDDYLSGGSIDNDTIRELIDARLLFPCYFGSALKNEGVRELLDGLYEYTMIPEYPESFGARVYKISRDEQGSRLTFMKITGGELAVKSVLAETGEKINDIRIYSGSRYESVSSARAGEICAVAGPMLTRFGQVLGCEKGEVMPVLEPVMSYRIILPQGTDERVLLPKLKALEEEEPELKITRDERLNEIQAKVMGQVQLEVLKTLIRDRYGTEVEFGTGSVLYKETIAAPAIGIGHYEPLKHYAEVHLLLEPGEPGSGIRAMSVCSEDMLDKNWQRLIVTHILEKEHIGVLTGSQITDITIKVISGRAHIKHTEGGDFRQATYRAIRQGLMQAQAILLEPYYDFTLTLPQETLGRAMSDIEKMSGTFEIAETGETHATIRGTVPVICMNGYQNEVNSYTSGRGNLNLVFRGYDICHNSEEVVEARAYDAEADLENPSSSVFCSHGAGFNVTWECVPEYKHVEDSIRLNELELEENVPSEQELMERAQRAAEARSFIGYEEVDSILDRTVSANRRVSRSRFKKTKTEIKPAQVRDFGKRIERAQDCEEYLLIDGYNIIYAWDELAELLKTNLDGAKTKMMDIVCNYAGTIKAKVIVVFDAYRVQGHPEETYMYNNIRVVYTKEAETADRYIERFAHNNGRRHIVTVATSDRLEQIIIRGQGCRLLSARDLWENIKSTEAKLAEHIDAPGRPYRNSFESVLNDKSKEELKKFLANEDGEK